MTVELLPSHISPEDTLDQLLTYSVGIDCHCGKSKALPPYTSVVLEVDDQDQAEAWLAKHHPHPPRYGDDQGWSEVLGSVESLIADGAVHGITTVCPACTKCPDSREEAIALGHIVPLRDEDR